MVIRRGLGVGGQSAMRAPRSSGLSRWGSLGRFPRNLRALARSEKRARSSYRQCCSCSRALVLLLVVVARARAGCCTRALLQVTRAGNTSTSVGWYLFGSGASVLPSAQTLWLDIVGLLPARVVASTGGACGIWRRHNER